jgi:predicted enzyme related to lactoylglutathione lyase
MSEYATNSIAHFDVAGPDLRALGTFYQEVLGWQPEEKGPGYALVRTPEGGPDGALVEAESGSLTIGVVVDDLAGAVAAAARTGSVEMPPTDNGWVVKAQVRDPAGNLLTLIAR